MPSPNTNCRRMVSFLPALRFELRFRPQPWRRRRVELVVERVVPLDHAEHAGGSHVAPVLRVLVGAGDVRQREPRPDALRARCGRRRCPGRRSRPAARARASALCRPWTGIQRTWTLRKNTMPGRSPVLERVREHVRIHERAPRLSGAERAELAVGVPQPERGLALVHAGAEQLELERRLQLAERRSASRICTPSRL